MKERKPRRGDHVRIDGRQGIVYRADYSEWTCRVKFTDKKGGIKALEIDRMLDNWDGRKWDVPYEGNMYAEWDDRLDVEILFDMCLAGEHPTHPDYVCDTVEKRISRLEFLLTYMKPDNLRHTVLKIYREKPDAGFD